MDFFLTRDVFQENKKYFDNQMSEYVFYSKYSRWRDDLGRREVWSETVDRACNYLMELSENKLSDREYKRIHDAMLKMEVMPSMRLLAMAGKAARRNPISCYNCAAIAMNEIAAFVEIMYLSMNGVGVGFSVERRFTDKFPVVERQHVSPRGNLLYAVQDSTEGWCDAFKMGLSIWWGGGDVVFDYSHIRPAGAILKTKGGQASGYLPLKQLLDFSRDMILQNQGKRLSTVDIYDIVTKIADCVVMGSMRRSALLALFDFDDDVMMTAKNGEYWVDRPWRVNSNNSAVWTRELTKDEIDAFFDVMHDGFNGEPGFFSRYATMKTLPLRRNKEYVYGTNACGEAQLPISEIVTDSDGNTHELIDGGGLCNLTQVVARAGDTVNQLCDKAEIAAIIGTIQALATDFHFLRPGWKRNAEEEVLIGVDVTGHYDCEEARDPLTQIAMKSCVVMTNKRVAKELGIPQAAATTLVKPSGNSGVLLNVSSGVHPRWSKFYKRNVRVNVNSPLFEVLKRSGMLMVQESDTTYVIGFAIKSPDGAITRDEVDAKTHLEYWKQVKTCYTEHSVSMTCYYSEDELDFVKQWVYENQDVVSGLSFLPRSDAKYENAPYVDLTEEEYYELKAMEPVIDFGLLQDIEHVDGTESSHELSCSAGQCDMRL